MSSIFPGFICLSVDVYNYICYLIMSFYIRPAGQNVKQPCGRQKGLNKHIKRSGIYLRATYQMHLSMVTYSRYLVSKVT